MVLQMDSARQKLFKMQQNITNCNKLASKDSTLMLSNEFGFCSISSDGSDICAQVQALLQNQKKKKLCCWPFTVKMQKPLFLKCFDLHIFSWYFQCCVNVWYSCLIMVIVFSDSGSSIISKAHSKSSVLRKTTNLLQVFFDQLILWAIQSKGQPWKNERLQLSYAILISV